MPALILGSVIFQGFEIPEKLHGLGGRHQLAVKKLIGGERVVDAMGPDAADIRWSGKFQGGNAVGRARRVDQLRQSGQQVMFAWGGIAHTVVVQEFEFEPERTYQVPYHICLMVVSNSGADSSGGASLDTLVGSDMALASGAVAEANAVTTASPQPVAQASYPPGGI
jgi:hypothetical protein